MPGESRIEWTDATWNPVTGCTQVSRGCDNCYAKTFAERWRGIPGHPYEQGFDLKLWPERLEIPLRWTRPRRIFVNSMSDLFHADVPTDFVASVFAVMAMSPWHVYQVLTKRPQRMMRLLSDDAFRNTVHNVAGTIWARRERRGKKGTQHPDWPGWPLPNVWVGTSVEDQEVAWRIDFLAKTPAAVRFLSCEPLLGPLDLVKWLQFTEVRPDRFGAPVFDTPIHWVITGGESGPGHRSIDPDWVRSIRDQCQAAGVAFFHKQWGGLRPKSGGRELDGRTWDEMPSALSAR